VKAVVIHAPGAPEQLVIAEVAEPSPGPGEVLVDVAYAGCNWADTQNPDGSILMRAPIRCVAWRYPAGCPARAGATGVKVGDASRPLSSAAAPTPRRQSLRQHADAPARRHSAGLGGP